MPPPWRRSSWGRAGIWSAIRWAQGLRNIVAVVERPDWHDEGWSLPGDPADLRAAFARFGGPVPDWLARVDSVGVWGLFRHRSPRIGRMAAAR
jgi:hypothetical protein